MKSSVTSTPFVFPLPLQASCLFPRLSLSSSRDYAPPLFPQDSLASSTSTTIRRQRLRRLTSSRRALRRMLGNVSSSSSLSLSLPPFLPTCLPPCRLLRYPFPRLAWYQMEIAQDTCRRRRRRWRRRSHVDEIFSYSPSDSRIVCFDVHIYLTRISSGVVPPTKVIPATAIHLSREGCTGGVRVGR